MLWYVIFVSTSESGPTCSRQWPEMSQNTACHTTSENGSTCCRQWHWQEMLWTVACHSTSANGPACSWQWPEMSQNVACPDLFPGVMVLLFKTPWYTQFDCESLNPSMESPEEESTVCTSCCSDSSSSQALTAQSQTFLRPDTPNNASGTGEKGDGQKGRRIENQSSFGLSGRKKQNLHLSWVGWKKSSSRVCETEDVTTHTRWDRRKCSFRFSGIDKIFIHVEWDWRNLELFLFLFFQDCPIFGAVYPRQQNSNPLMWKLCWKK